MLLIAQVFTIMTLAWAIGFFGGVSCQIPDIVFLKKKQNKISKIAHLFAYSSSHSSVAQKNFATCSSILNRRAFF